MSKRLIPLDQYNSMKAKQRAAGDKPQPNGIECPQCKEEMYDSNPFSVITTFPAKKNIHCPGCGYEAYRLV